MIGLGCGSRKVNIRVQSRCIELDDSQSGLEHKIAAERKLIKIGNKRKLQVSSFVLAFVGVRPSNFDILTYSRFRRSAIRREHCGGQEKL